jgi:uncharacterized membrane protein
MREGNFKDPILFEARLKPYRSLPPQGFFLLMAVLAAASFVTGIAFVIAGAWPVFGFLGLDVALVWLAFRVNYRAARAYEDIHLTPNLLRVRQVSARGVARETEFNPRWVQLEKNEDALSGVTRIALISRGIPLVIGAFLPPMHKSELATALSAALVAAKR